MALLVVASVSSEQALLNRGPTRNAMKKAREKDLPWWVLHANAAAKINVAIAPLSETEVPSSTLPVMQLPPKIPRRWQKDTDAYIQHIERVVNKVEMCTHHNTIWIFVHVLLKT